MDTPTTVESVKQPLEKELQTQKPPNEEEPKPPATLPSPEEPKATAPKLLAIESSLDPNVQLPAKPNVAPGVDAEAKQSHEGLEKQKPPKLYEEGYDAAQGRAWRKEILGPRTMGPLEYPEPDLSRDSWESVTCYFNDGTSVEVPHVAQDPYLNRVRNPFAVYLGFSSGSAWAQLSKSSIPRCQTSTGLAHDISLDFHA